jgi:hypothetical protein
MKKIIIFALALSLLVPAVAFAKSEFSLGGFIKLDTFWDSTNNSSLMHTPTVRSNADGQHGRFNMRACESRFNLTIKGPEVFGAKLTGFFEMDFDGTPDQNVSASGTWVARMRHAMFRLNWPETELLMGQYWGMFSNWWTEGAEDGPFIQMGNALDRLPQIRLTQKFLGDWSVAALIGMPVAANLTSATPYNAAVNNGSSAETPQIQGMIKYQHDWWGKAAYYGSPIPFTVTVSAGWQRSVSRDYYSAAAAATQLRGLGENGYVLGGANDHVRQKFVDPWMVQGALFIPLIPTHSANLAGTASILTQWFIGQGVEAFGVFNTTSAIYKYVGTDQFGTDQFDVRLMPRFGGWAQAQYYFTNQWYVNAAYGITRCYSVNRATEGFFAGTDEFRSTQQVDATLWFRPVKALKFGLQYAFMHSDYFQRMRNPNVAGGNITNNGDEHRVEFVGIFYF